MLDDYVNKTRCQWQRLMGFQVHKNLVLISCSTGEKNIVLQLEIAAPGKIWASTWENPPEGKEVILIVFPSPKPLLYMICYIFLQI